MKIQEAIKKIKDDVIRKSEILIDDDGIARKIIDPLVVIEIINERLQEIEE
jgi:hypothetical protein